MPYAAINGQRVFFQAARGDGRPVLLGHGTEDAAIPMDAAEALAAGLPGADGVVAVAARHAANLADPQPVNDAIRGILGGLPA